MHELPGISHEAATVRELVKVTKEKCGEIPDADKSVQCRAATEELENDLDSILQGEEYREPGEDILK